MGISVVMLASLLSAARVAGSTEACDVHQSVLLREPRVLSNGTLIDTVQGISYPPGTHFEVDGAHRGCPCKIGSVPCLRKCCSIEMALDSKSKCIPYDGVFRVNLTKGWDKDTTKAVDGQQYFALLTGRYCASNSSYYLDPEMFFEDEFFIWSNGKLTTPHHSGETEYGVEDFCIDYSLETGGNRVMFCTSEDFHDQTESRRITSIVYPILMLISVPPLLLTFLVYALIAELRNLHGKCLMCYVLCLMFSYIFLAISHLGLDNLPESGCIATAFLSQFTFLGAFFWLNVMCIDICLTYCIKKQPSQSAHVNERKKFIIYSAYAWSCTSVIVIISLIMDLTPGIPKHYLKPRFGLSRCWFDRKIEAFLFFYGPFSILISCNIIMYLITAIKLYQLKKMMMQMNDPEPITRTEKDNRIRFKLYLKLLFIMGIIWVTEIIGWAVDGPDYFWYLTDVINCLQGLLIFIIFVWQKRVRKIIVLKLCPQVIEGQSTRCSFFGKCCMVNNWSPNRASEARDTSSSAILSPPKGNIKLQPMDESSKMNGNNDEAV